MVDFWVPWVVALALVGCGEVEPLDGRVATTHPAGYAEGAGHGDALRAAGFPLADCLSCHREDEGPGACNDCHEQGVEDCAVCHREPDRGHRPHEALDCVTCHPVPAALGSPGHLEDRGAADVVFSGLAAGGGHAPTYADRRCADTACHAGADAAEPALDWGASFSGPACTACHGLPPAAHPGDRCDRCHAPVADAVGGIVNAAMHGDGRVQAEDWLAMPCDGCHGADGEAAPPRDLAGRMDGRAVGAHRAHLQPEGAAPVACTECHRVPERNDSPGHVDDGAPGAEVVLEGAGRYTAGGCADTACHGADQPSWTGDAPCGSCHGLPPTDHPAGDCARCHPTAGPGRTIARPLEHVDGAVDVHGLGEADCATCHADGGPVVPGGSHAAHARAACDACHPMALPVAAHLDGVTAVVLQVGAYAGGGCADTTCHREGRPVWGDPTSVDGCGACHGDPPAPHPRGDCGDCHPGPEAPTHVDGAVDLRFAQACTDCHGDPPPDASHQQHAEPAVSRGVPCEACHVVPEAVDAAGHIDPPPAEVRLATGAYADGRCSDTDCHAGPGGQTPAPTWGGPAIRCGDCHGVPPPRHLPGACGECHPAVADGYDVQTPARHVDGVRDFR